MPAVVRVQGLRKSYGPVEAVRGIDLEVRTGEVFAFLGPNGAGKTTTVEILEGYRRRDGGEVSVLGEDPERAGTRWRERIGIVLQSAQPDPFLTVRETVAQFAGYYAAPRGVDETIGRVGLSAERDRRVRRLSGGQRRRLDVALALVGDPELLFLDEPTTGFDPAARRGAWGLIGSLRDLGKTVFLTTHYMDEAQALADRVALIVAGQIVAEGPPNELGGRNGEATRICFTLPEGASPPPGIGEVAREGRRVTASTHDPVPALHELTGWALANGVALEGLRVERPSLEDVYLRLTGGR